MIHWQPGVTLDEVEKETILSAFRFYHGNRQKTADSLGVSARTIYNKLKSYGMDGAEVEPHDNTKTNQRKL